MNTDAQQKYAALLFCKQQGLNATIDAFKVSRSSLYVWPSATTKVHGRAGTTVVKCRTAAAGVIDQ